MRYTEYLKAVLRELLGIKSIVHMAYFVGRHKILVCDDGVWEMDELQQMIRCWGKGENAVVVVGGEWREMLDQPDDDDADDDDDERSV